MFDQKVPERNYAQTQFSVQEFNVERLGVIKKPLRIRTRPLGICFTSGEYASLPL